MSDPAISKPPKKRFGLSFWIVTALVSGIATGLFFGDYCQKLKILGDAFIGLLEMTVLPYITVTLIANIGRLSVRQGKALAGRGALVLLAMWILGCAIILLLSTAYPDWNTPGHYVNRPAESSQKGDWLRMFIPSNPFDALANSLVPAVVLFCIFLGVAFMTVDKKEGLFDILDVLCKGLVQVNHYVVRLTPVGVFAMTASAAGTMSIDEFGRLQAYLITFTAGVFLLAFVILPALLVSLTPFSYRDISALSRDAFITALATGKLIIVLPILIEQTKALCDRYFPDRGDLQHEIDVLYPLIYPFPNLGKVLSLLFVPFSAWFLGREMTSFEFAEVFMAGILSLFGNVLVTISFLLGMLEMPKDMLQLLALAGFYCGRIADVLGVMHLIAFTLVTMCWTAGILQVRVRRLLAAILASSILTVTTVVGIHIMLGAAAKEEFQRTKVIETIHALRCPDCLEGRVEVLKEPAPNPVPLRPGQSALGRIRERRIMRVGFDPDQLPYSFFTAEGKLAGLDIELAYRLAEEMGVGLEFVPTRLETLIEQVNQDHFDIAMCGIVGTIDLMENVSLSHPYLDTSVAGVVLDSREQEFNSFQAMQQVKPLRIGYLPTIDEMFKDKLRRQFPHAQFVSLKNARAFFEDKSHSVDLLLTTSERGGAWTHVYPQYTVVHPEARRVSLPLVYLTKDETTRQFMNHWVELARKDGTIDEVYDRWIHAKSTSPKPRRWSVIRDVLHWVD